VILEPIKPRVLAVRMIPDVDPQLAPRLNLKPHHRSAGLITCTSDDCLYAALDEGTKAAEADVVYAKSFYAGAAHASGPLSGEIIGVFAAPDPETVSSAIQATVRYLEYRAWFFAADDRGALAFFPHVIPAVGRYLAAAAGVEPGTPMAYQIAPPIEAMLGLDAALKAATVELRVFYAPPSETNFAGGLLVGDVPAVEAAAAAFQATVLDLAQHPIRLDPAPEVEELAATFGKVAKPRGDVPALPYRMHDSGMELSAKPDDCTHLFDNRSLVRKDHPVIRFRGRLDLLQAQVIDATVAARQEGRAELVADLDDVLRFLRGVMAAEVTGRPVPELHIGGFDAEELHRMSHQTMQFLGVGWVVPDSSMGPAVAKLNLARASCRELELEALACFDGTDHLAPGNRDRLIHGLNRLSNALYVLVCRTVGHRER
jgi:ethanolamine utilization protein EutL